MKFISSLLGNKKEVEVESQSSGILKPAFKTKEEVMKDLYQEAVDEAYLKRVKNILREDLKELQYGEFVEQYDLMLGAWKSDPRFSRDTSYTMKSYSEEIIVTDGLRKEIEMNYPALKWLPITNDKYRLSNAPGDITVEGIVSALADQFIEERVNATTN